MSLALAELRKPSGANRRAPSGRYRFGMAAVIVAAATLYLLGGQRISLWDCDESWYAQSSKQMLERGNWVVPRFIDQDRYAKPVFIYWCQATSMNLLGPTSLAARLPSAIAVTLILSLLAIVIDRTFGARRALYTVLVLGTSMMVITAGKMCTTDGVLLLFITGAQICLFRIYRRHAGTRKLPVASCQLPDQKHWQPATDNWQLCMWLCVGLAALTKGPFVLAVLLATILGLAALDVGAEWRSAAAWKRSVAWWPALRPMLGICILIAMIAPWLICASLRNPNFVRNMLFEPVRHLKTNQSGGQPSFLGYHVLAIWIGFFPWCLLLPAAIAQGWRYRRAMPVRFAMATVFGNLVFVELMVTKLPHYFLPAYSSLAFLAACAIIRTLRRRHTGLLSWPALAGAGVWAIATIALSLGPWAPIRFGFDIPKAAAVAFTSTGIAYALAVVVCLAMRKLAAAAMTMGFGLIAVLAILVGWYLPQAEFVHIPERVGQRLKAIGAAKPGDVAMIGIRLYDPAEYPGPGYPSPSLAFYQGGTIRERTDDFLVKAPVEDWPRWLVMTDAIYQKLPGDRRKRLEPIATYRGFNYNIPVNVVQVMIFRKM